MNNYIIEIIEDGLPFETSIPAYNMTEALEIALNSFTTVNTASIKKGARLC